MKRIYMSVEEGFEKSPPNLYRTSKSIINKLNNIYDLFLVHPGDYDIETLTIKQAFKIKPSSKLEKVLDSHEPRGDLFIIYGDETSKNIGFEFAEQQYDFLEKIESSGNFSKFLNKPGTEKNTLKNCLVDLSKDISFGIASTFKIEHLSEIKEYVKNYGSIIAKPIFGCRGSGVFKIESSNNLEYIFENKSIDDYVFQEPLAGPEKRVVLLNGELLCSRIHYDRETPWSSSDSQKTYVYQPNDFELEVSKLISKTISADIIGVDFIGDKINEINGTGTALITYDHNDNLLYDKTDDFVKLVSSLVDGDYDE